MLYDANVILRVVEGFHSLQLYANAFWVEHLLEYASLNPRSDGRAGDPLMTQLLELYDRFIRHSGPEIKSTVDAFDTTTERLQDIRIQNLTSWGDIYGLVRQVLTHRQASSRHQQAEKSE